MDTNVITLNQIRGYSPCKSGWEKLLKSLGKTQADDEPLSLVQVLDSNGVEDAIWCLRVLSGDPRVPEFAIWCARQVQSPMRDERSVKALGVAEAYQRGEATIEELRAAYDAAAAADAAYAAAYAAAAYAYDAADYAAARSEMRDRQAEKFRELFGRNHP